MPILTHISVLVATRHRDLEISLLLTSANLRHVETIEQLCGQ